MSGYRGNEMSEGNEFKVKKIEEGIVIDHIRPGNSLEVLSILGINRDFSGMVTVAMNVESKSMGKKDIVKVEKREIAGSEINKIALIAPEATINWIKGYDVVKKSKVELPEVLVNVVKCKNPKCITQGREPIASRFIVESKDPLKIRCAYCERTYI